MNKKIYEFNDLHPEVQKFILDGKVDEIVDMTERNGYVDSLPDGHYIKQAIQKADALRTPWFLAEYIFELGKEEIISEVSRFQYDFFGNRVAEDKSDSELKQVLYLVHFVKNSISRETTLHMTPEEALDERKKQVESYCRIFTHTACDCQRLSDIERPYYLNDYENTYWAIYECEMPHELKLFSYQHSELRKTFNEHIENVLGKDYYNEGMDVYTCDRLACRDIEKRIGIKGLIKKGGKVNG